MKLTPIEANQIRTLREMKDEQIDFTDIPELAKLKKPRVGRFYRPPNDSYARAAANYKPDKTRILFIAEAPPLSLDRYFYFEDVKRGDWLWIALMKALYGDEWGDTKTERSRKRHWLSKFRDSGFQLIDAVKKPINGNARHRISRISSAAQELITEVKEIDPKQIVLIKTTVHEALSQPFRDADLPLINEESLPFPAAGRQMQFEREFLRLVDSGRLQL